MTEVEAGRPLVAWLHALAEREVIHSRGLSNQKIADRLCIADSTVRHHLTNIFD